MKFHRWPLRTKRTRTTIKLRRKGDPAHGSYAAYQRGCGCDRCRAGNTLAQQRKRRGAYTPEAHDVEVAAYPVDRYARRWLELYGK